jgi:hypothetical protein
MRLRHVMLTHVLFCILVAVLAWSDPAIAQVAWEDDSNLTLGEDAEPLPVEAPEPATTQYLHVAGSAFVPLYADSGVTYGTKGCTYMTSATHLFMNYSLDLPNNAIVTYVRLYFNDTAATDGTLHLAEYDDGAAYTYLATVTTSGSSGLGYSVVSGLSIPLDYVNYNYVMYWMPGVSGNTMQLCGFRVGYEYFQ